MQFFELMITEKASIHYIIIKKKENSNYGHSVENFKLLKESNRFVIQKLKRKMINLQ